MPSTILEELIGKEVSVSVFNDMPVKGVIVAVDDCFVKIEGPVKNFKQKEYYVNKAMIASITVK